MSDSPYEAVVLGDGVITLRDPLPADRSALVSLADDERLFTYMMIRFSRADMDGWFGAWLEELHATPRAYWPLVIDAESPTGFAMINRTNEGVAELQWYVSPDAWGRGYATRATRLAIPFAFESLGLHRVFATVDPENVASVRVLERAGFRREGHMRDYVLTHRGWRDRLLYALLATDH